LTKKKGTYRIIYIKDNFTLKDSVHDKAMINPNDKLNQLSKNIYSFILFTLGSKVSWQKNDAFDTFLVMSYLSILK
jgi:hypothetical protein